MEDRILKTSQGAFEMMQWDGVNASGIDPLADKVVVRVDAALAKVGSIIITDGQAERQTLSSTTGLVVAVGPQAFRWSANRAEPWEGDRPEPGARVCFLRYAGQEYTGLDGVLYRVMEDRSIAGTMKQQAGVASQGITMAKYAG